MNMLIGATIIIASGLYIATQAKKSDALVRNP
jgi:hypothetical protein